MVASNPVRMMVVAGTVVVLAFLGLTRFGPTSSTALAEATVTLNGQRIQFQLRPVGEGVEALVSFDADLVHFRRSGCKRVPGATHAAARRARFEFNPDQRHACFLMEGGGVAFVQSTSTSWGIQPWQEQLANEPSRPAELDESSTTDSAGPSVLNASSD